jgi:hypothetical protein
MATVSVLPRLLAKGSHLSRTRRDPRLNDVLLLGGSQDTAGGSLGTGPEALPAFVRNPQDFRGGWSRVSAAMPAPKSDPTPGGQKAMMHFAGTHAENYHGVSLRRSPHDAIRPYRLPPTPHAKLAGERSEQDSGVSSRRSAHDAVPPARG